jgi:hypothetical protein
VLRFLYHVFLTLWLSFLIAAALQSHRTGDMSSVQGLGPSPDKNGGQDVLERMEQAVWRRAETLEITEVDLNRYLANALVMKQAGRSREFANFERVAVDLEPDLCRIWFVWKIAGHATTATIDLTLKRKNDTFITEVTGGSYGRLKILQRGALATLVPACTSLAASLDDEIHTLFQMNQIHFLKDKVLLDPRFEAEKEPSTRP